MTCPSNSRRVSFAFRFSYQCHALCNPRHDGNMPPEHASASATALRLAPGEQVVLSGCARVSVTRGELWVHGHVVGPGQHAVLRSCAEVGSLLVLEATQRSALRATLSALERSPGAPLPPSEMLPGPYRVPRQSAYGFEVAPAGGQGTVLPPVRACALCKLSTCTCVTRVLCSHGELPATGW